MVEGTFSFKTGKAPGARFVCHCLFCEDFTGEAFSDVSVLMAHQIEMKGTADRTQTIYVGTYGRGLWKRILDWSSL